jgi:fido (protein-threonine AMPylation protein)
MFADVWRWAGRLRTSPRNIGIDWWEIPAALRMLLDDAKAWTDQKAYRPMRSPSDSTVALPKSIPFRTAMAGMCA